MKLIERIHGGYAYGRRVDKLCHHLAEVIPANARVLDVGCGDGLVASLVMKKRPDVEIRGIDVLIRPRTHIPVEGFDGRVIPYEDDSFDAVMFVDVLHHTDDPAVLLAEAARVARQSVVIKDHTSDGILAAQTLRFMDDVGNARHGVVLPYNYWTKVRWLDTFAAHHLEIGNWKMDLKLYAWPADLIFGRSLHFVARLDLARGHAPTNHESPRRLTADVVGAAAC